ncbi:MAG TPA: [acyl-carrier-protein] S-malonyltransferase [Gemmatimonadetes bacterium]|jgi:[acyl-carrier-protein] S-malonyltransferase|nr:ACP S-malonyltransferase [Gemmatimonadota bacterium]HAC05263.1 [acyl-carrier-protein] S-malonyltransferase [Gemmatimonadota bacterium]HBD99634.1 [acyl-carrier-protein] S-malonyltransferase [Gemmatimonadota bacterium]HIC53608.1 ACP S-malonyltransferase [Gemmatimonadota bacterium]HIN52278.1 [acyl-carrier-protein] S-malonyltransferase [Gemmatimonadota bacterium]
MSLALIFPGQGSQVVGMGRALAASDARADAAFATADEVLGFSLSGLMRDGPEHELTATQNAQPAILAHSVAVLRTIEDQMGPVAYAAGHSLGEFSAHVAAGTLRYEDALAVVRLRGELMFAAGQKRSGTMAAILGLSDEEVEAVCTEVDAGTCVPANFNASGQVVVSGDIAGVEQGMERATDAGARRVVRLNVSGAFHSPLMEPAVDGLRDKLQSIEFQDPAYPVFSNVTASPVTSGSEARQLMVEQLTSAVRWSASVAAMVEAGADRFLELGPGSVLCGLNRRNAKGVPCRSIGDTEDLATSVDGA